MDNSFSRSLTEQPVSVLQELYQSRQKQHGAFPAALYLAFMALLVVMMPEPTQTQAMPLPMSAMISDSRPIQTIDLKTSVQNLGLDQYIEISSQRDTSTLRIKTQLLFPEGSSKLGRAGSRALSQLFTSSNSHPDAIELELIPRSNTGSELYEGTTAIAVYEARLNTLKQEIEKHTSATVNLEHALPTSVLPK